MTPRPLLAGANVVPGEYRGVSVTHLDTRLAGLDEDGLRERFVGREAYRRTRFLVLRDDAGDTAVLRVEKQSTQPLFSPIVDVEVLATPDACAFVEAPDADTAVPSTLASIAVTHAPGAHAVVVRGLYEHVSFIVNPRPLRVVVQEIVPPEPAKLLDQVCRLLAVAEELPPMIPVPDTVTFAELAARAPASRYLLPCGGSGVTVDDAATDYLDRRPERVPWTLLGCARSTEIHRWFYGDQPATVDICPRVRARDRDAPVLTKCCLLEDRIVVEEGGVVVPWGATLGQVREALRAVARGWAPRWRPV
jgi:hypothetical protein